MATTNYTPFAAGTGALTMSTTSYTADSERPIGNQPGIARPELVNTVLRQATVVATGVAQFASSNSTLNVNDDGSPTTVANALLQAVQALITQALNTQARTGDIKATLNDSVQPGWLYCNGAYFSAASYPDLATLAVARGWPSTGSGPGLQYTLPDLRGEFLRGWDNGRGVDPGRLLGNLQLDDFKAHAHNVQVNDPDDGGKTYVGGANDIDAGAMQSTTTTGGVETRPRNYSVRFMIKT